MILGSCSSVGILKVQTVQVTPASSTWPQLVLPQPENLHWWILSSVPAHATSSIQIRPVPAQNRRGSITKKDMFSKIIQKGDWCFYLRWNWRAEQKQNPQHGIEHQWHQRLNELMQTLHEKEELWRFAKQSNYGQCKATQIRCSK